MIGGIRAAFDSGGAGESGRQVWFLRPGHVFSVHYDLMKRNLKAEANAARTALYRREAARASTAGARAAAAQGP